MGDQGSSPMELEDGKLEQTAMPSSESIDKHYEKEQPQFTRSETLLPHPPPPIPPSPNPKFLLPRAPENQHIPQILPNIHSKVYPDDNSPVYESIAQGLPPVQVAPSVEHLHEGRLGEVTHRAGAVT